MRRIKITSATGYWLLVTGYLSLAVTLSARLNDAVGQEVERSFAQTNTDSLIALYTQKMHKYLDKEGKASEVFSFTKEGIEVYVPATDTSQRKLNFIVFWNELNEVASFLNIESSEGAVEYFSENNHKSKVFVNIPRNHPSQIKSLANAKIIIDPGHIAGDLETAKQEKKWVEMKNPPAQLIEGELTLATALILRKKLEAQGAIVMLTRSEPNVSSFGLDYKKWKDSLFIGSLEFEYDMGNISFEEKSYLHTKANDTEIFRRFFMLEDLHERARKINEFHPDLTLIIHYNVDETNQNWNKPTKKDYVMGFVGGSFAKDEFEMPEARVEFLRLLLTDDVEHSIEFSKYIVNSLSEKLKVPAALDSNAIYLRDNCMKTAATGVYCRNLTLTRKVKGVICYGESLYQDNVNECKLLSKKDASTPLSVTGGVQTSKRVEEVAEAYYEGIMNYVKRKTE